MGNDLLPCPWCGGDANLKIEVDHHGEFFELGCKDGKCLGHWAYYTESTDNTPIPDAIIAWNTRITPAAGGVPQRYVLVDKESLEILHTVLQPDVKCSQPKETVALAHVSAWLKSAQPSKGDE